MTYHKDGNKLKVLNFAGPEPDPSCKSVGRP
jgi:hypothetical protein